MRTYGNGIIGVLASGWTWFCGSLTEIAPVIQFVGMTAGAITACITLAIAIRSWQRGREKAE